ncbi:MAG: hypothetical protein ACRC68_18460 [Clostridium sp.]
MTIYRDKITAKEYKIVWELPKYTLIEEISTGTTYMFDPVQLQSHFFKYEK